MNTRGAESAGSRGLMITAALLFVGSAAVTLAWCGSMAAMPDMHMPWMPMPAQGWWNTAATFVGMWTVMMIAMMLPAFTPALLRYRQATGLRQGRRLHALTALAALGYFSAWIAFGVVIYPVGVGMAALEMGLPMLARASPVVAALAVMLAGAWQLSAWKSRQLACCRHTMRPSFPDPVAARTAWRHGLRLGWRCLKCCAPLTALLLALGVMDLGAMAIVTLAIALERLAPAGQRLARLAGSLMLASGGLLLLRALAG